MIFIFNPETDYALAAGEKEYTAPKGVKILRLSLTPYIASTLRRGDFFMLYDAAERDRCKEETWGRECKERGVTLIAPQEVAQYATTHEIKAWGWNHSLRKMLIRHKVDKTLLPSSDDIENIRKLSHRRTTIPVNSRLNDLLSSSVPLPQEYTDVKEALIRLNQDPDCFIKSPWSSSGRGVNRSLDLSSDKLEARIRSCIEKQGSVMIERTADKVLDFATEWDIKNGEAIFLGLSVFRTGNDGEYAGNLIGSYDYLEAIIKESAPLWKTDIIEAQKTTLQEIIAPFYNGPAGIDMLADKTGRIWPCIEINLRHTMGHMALLQAENFLWKSPE